MKKVKKFFISTTLLFVLITLLPIYGYAAIMICTGPNCYLLEGSCTGPAGQAWVPAPPNEPTCTELLMFKPQVDYILVAGSKAFVVHGDQRIPLASDMLVAFISSINSKYAKTKVFDTSIEAKIQAEYKAFLRRDNGKISVKRMNLISKETGLAIRTSNKNSSK